MSFFDGPPPPPPEIPPPPPRQPWMGPPEGWLGGFVPVRLVLARTAELVITLGPMAAFPTGVSVTFTHLTRQPNHGPVGPGLMGGDARLGVAFADGSKWQSGGHPFPDPYGEPPAGPLLLPGGGGGGGHEFRMSMWLWPLPPAGPVTFALAMPDAGVDETTVRVPGEVFRDAADEAEQLWEPLTPEEERAIVQERLRHRPGGSFTTMRLQATKPEPPN